MHRPVAKRRMRAGARLSTHMASAPLSAAPASALQPMRARGETMSGRLASAEPSVPRMKPAWTAMVSPARPPARDGADGCARADHAPADPGRRAQARAESAAHHQAGQGAGGHRAGWIKIRLLLRLEPALVTVAVEGFAGLPLAGQHLIPRHLRAG